MKRDLATIIEDELPKTKLKKKQLAKLVGLSGSHFSNISNRKASSRKSGYQPDPDVVNKLAYHLDLSVEEILEGLGYELSNTPDELFRFIAKYKQLPDSKKFKVLNIINLIIEVVVEDGESLGMARLNEEEVNVRIVKTSGNLPKILKQSK